MSMAIAILDERGAPSTQIILTNADHQQLFEVIKQNTYSLLTRMNDYYEDADFFPKELQALLGEIHLLKDPFRENPSVSAFLISFEKLVQLAITQNRTVAVISD